MSEIKPDPETMKVGSSIATDTEGYLIMWDGFKWERLSSTRLKDWKLVKGFPRHSVQELGEIG